MKLQINKNLAGEFNSWNQSLFFLLLVAAIFGLAMGIQSSTWQASVESAQFILGLVKYPPDSIEYELNAAMFSLLNYFSAFFLQLTNSEVMSSIITSAAIGIMAFQVLAMVIFLFSRNVLLSIFMAAVIAFNDLFGWGISYPIYFVGTPHGFGRIALFFPLYSILLICLSQIRVGSLLLGISVGMHPTSGIWAIGCYSLAQVIGSNFLSGFRVNRQALKYFFCGIGFVVLAYLYQKWKFPVVNLEDYEISRASQIFNNYIRFWDYHRRKIDDIPFISNGLLLAFSSLVISALLLKGERDAVLKAPRIFLKFVIISTTISIPLVFIPSWFDPGLFPSLFVASMPGRFINFSIFLLPPLLAVYLNTLIKSNKYLSYLVVGAFITATFSYTYGLGSFRFVIITLALPFLYLCSIFLKQLKITNLNKLTAATVAFMSASIIFSPFVVYKLVDSARKFNFRYSVIQGEVKQSTLITMHNFYFKAQHRLPTITPHLDAFTYLGVSPVLIKLNTYTKEVFGISLDSEPGDDIKDLHLSAFSLNDYQRLWAERTCEDWSALSEKYHFSLIEVPKFMVLKLPEASQDGSLRRYYPKCN